MVHILSIPLLPDALHSIKSNANLPPQPEPVNGKLTYSGAPAIQRKYASVP
jgi:hypothetical protein